jgi:hypothetical protein
VGDFSSLIQSLAPSYGVPPSLALALAKKESSLNPSAVGTSGEIGLFQVMPSTAAQFGVTNLYDPTANTQAGLSYLASLYKQYGNWSDALIAYNEGPGAFAAHGAYPVSQSYADSILAAAGLDASIGSDLTFTGDSSPSFNLFDSLDLSSVTGLSGAALAALVGVVVLGLVYAFSD